MVRREEDRLLERMEEAETLAAALKAAEAALKTGQAEVAASRQQMDAERTATERSWRRRTPSAAQVAAGVSAGALALFERVSQAPQGPGDVRGQGRPVHAVPRPAAPAGLQRASPQ